MNRYFGWTNATEFSLALIYWSTQSKWKIMFRANSLIRSISYCERENLRNSMYIVNSNNRDCGSFPLELNRTLWKSFKCHTQQMKSTKAITAVHLRRGKKWNQIRACCIANISNQIEKHNETIFRWVFFFCFLFQIFCCILQKQWKAKSEHVKNLD